MPGGNGRGPLGQGPVAGGGRGMGRGQRPGTGPGGNCVCPSCGEKVPHVAGKPCTFIKCPECGAQMIRE